MIKGIYIKDGVVYTQDVLDRPVNVNPPEPWITAKELNLTGDMAHMVQRRDWKARRKNQLRCNIVRASAYITAVLGTASLLTLEGWGRQHLGIVFGFMGINWAWALLIAIRNGGKV